MTSSSPSSSSFRREEYQKLLGEREDQHLHLLPPRHVVIGGAGATVSIVEQFGVESIRQLCGQFRWCWSTLGTARSRAPRHDRHDRLRRLLTPDPRVDLSRPAKKTLTAQNNGGPRRSRPLLIGTFRTVAADQIVRSVAAPADALIAAGSRTDLEPSRGREYRAPP